jgi:predicted P-loop ATPase
VIESPEGTGKSSAIELMAGPENFSDQKILSVGERELQEKFGGVWFYEIADLTGMKRAEVEDVKAMASRVTDRGRAAYAHFKSHQPRRCVIFATTNDDVYLKSQTGNRRFLPVKVGTIDLDALRGARDQLFAEAAYREAKGESIALPKELWADAQAEQEARRVPDPFEDLLEDFYGVPVQGEERAFSQAVVARLNIPAAQQTEVILKRIKASMERLGWAHKKSGIRIGAKVGKGYVRPERQEAAEKLRQGPIDPVTPGMPSGLQKKSSDFQVVTPVTPVTPINKELLERRGRRSQ